MISVMLVDDHRMVRDGVRWMLESDPEIEVVSEASSGAEMLSLLDHEQVDVILLDIRMPEMSGLDVMETLAEEGMPRVLVLSMYDDLALVQQAVALGASGYLKKSAGRDELLKAIMTVAGGRSYLDGDIVAPLVANLVDGPPEPTRLSDRDRDILRLMAQGLSNRKIAERLDSDEQQLTTEVQHLFARLGVSGRPQAVAAALRLGAID